MRSYDPKDKYDRYNAERLGAPKWMLDMLQYNPSYVCWGPHEDYMSDKDGGWRKPMIMDTWKEVWDLNDLNECVNFYFEINRESKNCPSCNGGGYNPETEKISEEWYDHSGDGNKRWCHDLTQDEVDALWTSGRLHFDFKKKPTADEVNTWSRKGKGMGHDSLNRGICVETRAKRLGVWGHCPKCEGHGYIFTANKCTLQLILWMLHPRKGCSRGVEIKDVHKKDLPAMMAYLKEAADRNADRFSKAAAYHEALTVELEALPTLDLDDAPPATRAVVRRRLEGRQ